MNFELSVPLIWLIIFDIVSLILVVREKRFKLVFKYRLLLLFPIFATASLFWTLNLTRGLLTAGIMWLLYFAVFSFVALKDLLKDAKFKTTFWRWFFGSALAICAWCWVQCILDIAGVPRENSLLCAGCTSYMFGFPHPNGFAIEPQFMGNLLLAPAIISGYFVIRQVSKNLKHKSDFVVVKLTPCEGSSFKFLLICFLITTATLFLTFSRGAIYAFLVAMVFLSFCKFVQAKSWRAFKLWPLIILAFLFTLNLQGIFAAVSPTSDTYTSGIAKVINHLSLGTIDFRPQTNSTEEQETITSQTGAETIAPVTFDPADDITIAEEPPDSVFDGYVPESTNTRIRLTESAIAIWHSKLNTLLIGVGLGGAGWALYGANLSPAPKEIVQNEYASILLELGLAGILLFAFSIIYCLKLLLKTKPLAPARVPILTLTLTLAYLITLSFFSGLPNALHIYLLPALLTLIMA